MTADSKEKAEHHRIYMKTYKHKPTACLCGKPGKYRRWGLWVCEKCHDIEQRINTDRLFANQIYQAADNKRDCMIEQNKMNSRRVYSASSRTKKELERSPDELSQDRIIALIDVALDKWMLKNEKPFNSAYINI